MSGMTSTNAMKRLKKEYFQIKINPVPYVTAEPLPAKLLEWHFVLEGPENTAYEGGYYHGKIIFPDTYPFEPPSVLMITPNGRFVPDTKLCPDMRSWNPGWTLSTVMTALPSLMSDNTPIQGSVETPYLLKRRLAYESLQFNIKDEMFCELFPAFVEEIEQVLMGRPNVPFNQLPAQITNDITDEEDKKEIAHTRELSKLIFILS